MARTTNPSQAELDIVRNLDRFLRDPELARQRGKTGQALTWIGAVLWVAALFACFNDVPAWVVGLVAGAGGLCAGIGAWFSTFAAQWPVIRPFIDDERVRERLAEIERPRG